MKRIHIIVPATANARMLHVIVGCAEIRKGAALSSSHSQGAAFAQGGV